MAIVATIFFWLVYLVTTIIKQFFDGAVSYEFTLQAFSYLIVVTFLTFSALIYLITRQGALQRFSKHVRVPKAELDRYFYDKQPTITVLVPTYSEEIPVIRKTLLSAALQEYPKMRIVLLVDDPPYPTDPEVAAKLNQTRELGDQLTTALTKPYARFQEALKVFEHTSKQDQQVSVKTIQELAEHYTLAARFLAAMANSEGIEDHVDIFFKEQVLGELAKDLQLTADALEASVKENVSLPKARIHQLYRRLTWIFDADIAVFERKKFVSLSHEANKAMNLNSYIGLMGGSYTMQQTPDGPILLPAANGKADVVIPDSDYLLTLDADSILLRDYCLRLVYFLEQPDNHRIAVTQTPYSSFRGAATRLERLAGATTDIQHILHQGMTHYGATFWVGANAVIRKRALEDIVETEWVGGFKVQRFIQDRTVIEDTESSVDLVLHGWQLVNYPERLSYSATPPDFGALVVQRRRWANGGLLILPKLFAYVRERRRRGELVKTMEFLVRLNYMASLTWASFGLIFLLAYPYDSRLLSPFVVLAALPYFLAQASDLKYCGYKRSDIFRIYGFNLILLPVNLAGVLKSMQQALSGKKIPFARTPKVKNRTIAPMIYVIAPLLIVTYSVFTLWRDAQAENWANAAFAGFNALVASWAIIAYIGALHTLVDIWYGLTDWMYVNKKPKQSVTTNGSAKQQINWRAVLYHGNEQDEVPLALQGSAQSVPEREVATL